MWRLREQQQEIPIADGVVMSCSHMQHYTWVTSNSIARNNCHITLLRAIGTVHTSCWHGLVLAAFVTACGCDVQVSSALSMLTDIMNAHEAAYQQEPVSSTTDDGTISSSNAADSGFGPVLAAVLDPLLEMCKRSAEALSPDSPARLDDGARLDPNAYRIYLINCMAACQAVTSLRPFAAAQTAALGDSIQGQLQELVGVEVGRVLARCGLAEMVERIRLYQVRGQQ